MSFKHFPFSIVILVIAATAVVSLNMYPKKEGIEPQQQESLNALNPQPPQSSAEQSRIPDAANNQSSAAIPSSLNLPVPFTSQAPHAIWDQFHDTACEEASAVMVAAYFAGDERENIPPEEAEIMLQKLTTWEDSHLGYHLDTTAAETAHMINSIYNLSTDLIRDPTLDTIKQRLNNHELLIVPVNGRKIGNPHYKPPGPPYHMLVIRGYDGDMLITNDPGTKFGQGYYYPFAIIQAAIVDWNHQTETITTSQPVMVAVSQP